MPLNKRRETMKPELIPQPPPGRVKRPEGLPTAALAGLALTIFAVVAAVATFGWVVWELTRR
jgi:hypothetical protein